MLNNGNKARLEQVLRYIDDIFLIIKNHNNIETALEDKEGEYALMMCIVQIGETVSKITDPILNKKIPISKIVGLRNRIIHGYELFDRKIIYDVLKHHIPKLKETVTQLFRGDQENGW